MAAIDEILIPSLTLEEIASDGSTLTNPAADHRRLFLGEDGLLHLRDSAGTVTDIGGGSGDVATDAIWDAAGDLVYGTGANTGSRLAIGTAGQVLTVNAGATAPEWGAASGGGITRSTLGTTSIGASFQGTRGTYLKKITLATDGQIAAIVAGIKGDATNFAGAGAAVYSDAAGVPVNLLHVGTPALVNDSSAYATNMILNTTARLVGFSIGRWFAAADYWLAIKLFGGANNQVLLAYASGTGSDRTQADFHAWKDVSIVGTSAGSDDHTIYADILR